MIAFLIYLLQVSVCMALFYVLYHGLLRNETFFQFNRAYLVGTSILALLIPAINITWSGAPDLAKYTTGSNPIAQYYQAPITINLDANNTLLVAGELVNIEAWMQQKSSLSQSNDYKHNRVEHIFGETIHQTNATKDNPFTPLKILLFIYTTGFTFFALRFLLNMAALFRLAHNGKIKPWQRLKIVEIKDPMPVFSFFHYIFWSIINRYSSEEQQQIIEHERIHAQQWHSIDVLLFEVLQVFCWFNPIVYLFKRHIRATHEFIVDKEMITKAKSPYAYAQLLVQQAKHWQPVLAITNNFNHPQTLRRLSMMTKDKTHWLSHWRLGVVLPVVLLLLGLFSFKDIDRQHLKAFLEEERTSFYEQLSDAEDAFLNDDFALMQNHVQAAFKRKFEATAADYYNVAYLYALTGAESQAYELLYEAIDYGYTDVWIRTDKKLMSLRLNQDKWAALMNYFEEHLIHFEKNLNKDLRYELFAMRDANQERVLSDSIEQHYGQESKQMEAFWIQMRKVDETNAEKLKKIVAEHGWPTANLVGIDAATAAWLILQQADLDFQKQCLPLVKEAMDKGVVSPQNYAFLLDKILVNEFEKQQYGTQMYAYYGDKQFQFYPIDNELAIEQRRSALGLVPLHVYAKRQGITYYQPDSATLANKIAIEQEKYAYNWQQASKDYQTATQLLQNTKNVRIAHALFQQSAVGFLKALQYGIGTPADFYTTAKVVAYLGDKELTFRCLQKAIDKGFEDWNDLEEETAFEELKTDSRWKVLQDNFKIKNS